MNRRDFMGSSLAAFLAGAFVGRTQGAGASEGGSLVSPRDTALAVRPVMTNIVHSGLWEGPCRWDAVGVADERSGAEANFARWSKQVVQDLGGQAGIELLPPAHLTFAEDFVLTQEQLRNLTRDGKQADVLLVAPHGASFAAVEVGRFVGTPVIVQGLNCRTVDIAAYARSKGQEAFVPHTPDELRRLLVVLRARKVFGQTRVLFPTDRGLPPVASVASINDLDDLARRHGVEVKPISYDELKGAMEQTLASAADRQKAEAAAGELMRHAEETLLRAEFVTRSLQFYQTIARLMGRHGCNAFTIECFEFCSSRLPEKWKITPCLVHTLLKDQGHASSCEADLGALLSMRLLMSVSQKASHLGNTFLRPGGVLGVNHSAAGLKMNGYDQPVLPYKLGRFVQSGWGAKAVVDFTKNEEKRVTVARIDPTATRMLVLKGRLVGSDGWQGDNIGCSVEARIEPCEGKAEDFIRRQLDYGNHLIWVYGHYVDEMRQLGDLVGMNVDVFG
ncbi:MAG: hypothetical protein JXB62_16140 [Pirellulales bacterium]|nr:hypothetical protein [Pirellulales bacterium]